MNRARLVAEWWLIVAFTLALVIGLTLGKATDSLDNVAYDALIGVRAPAPSDRIILVAIDNPSLSALGKWPWSRATHARLLERIAKARPAAVAYDVLFTEASVPGDDAALGQALRLAAPASLPALTEVPGRNGSAIDIAPPIPPIRAGARHVGHVLLATDRDGTVRRVALTLPAGGTDWPHLMETVYRELNGRPSPAWDRARSGQDREMAIPFQPGTGRFRTVSASSVLANEVPDLFLAGKIVLVGATAGGLGDQYRVAMPGGGVMSGVEIQANILNGLLADRTIRPVRQPMAIAISSVVILILLIGFWWLTPARGLALAIGLILLTLLVPPLLLVLTGLWFPPVATLMGLVLAYPLWGWRRLHAVDRAIGDELALFRPERIMPDHAPSGPTALLDRIGGHVAALRLSIAQMRDLKQLLDDTLESIADPLVVTAPDGRVQITNGPATALFGQDAIGADFDALLQRVAATTQTTAQGQYVETADQRAFSVRRSPLSDSAGRQRGWIVLLVDISLVRQAEREKDAALEFLSHDMRSPQAAIISLLDRQPGEALPPGTVERIRSSARRTLSLAENFVQLARLQVAAFQPEPVDLLDMMTEAVDALWTQASKRQIRIVAAHEDEPCLVMGEAHALSRSFINLLDNAVKHSPDGGEIHCRISPAPDGLAWLCTIEDEGAGVPEDLRGRLFERFSMGGGWGSGTLSSGLGLAFVRTTAQRHGGTVRYEPRLPRGARFILSLPADPS